MNEVSANLNSDFSGHTIGSITIDDTAHLIVITTVLIETGFFDGAGMWIDYDTPIYEEKHELIFSDVSSHSGVPALEKELLGTITSEKSQGNKTFQLVTQSQKTAVITAIQLDVTKHTY